MRPEIAKETEEFGLPIPARTSFLERPIASLLTLNWEIGLFAGLILVAAALRFWDLGSRALHHDESLHAYYSWLLYKGLGYKHDSMMHGPLQFHLNTVIFFLFGATDYTARIIYALFGSLLAGLPYFLRRELGRAGALVAAALLVFSPSMLYFSRFARNDVLIVVWTMVMVIALWRYLSAPKPIYLYLFATALALSFATKEVTYITVAIIGGFLAVAVAGYGIIEVKRRSRDWVQNGGWLAGVWRRPIATFTIMIVALSLPQASAGIRVIWERLGYQPTGQMILFDQAIPTQVIPAALAVVGLLLVSLWIGHLGVGKRWWIAAAVFYAIFALLYTTFFTNPTGFGTGIWGSLDYWLAQQGVKRGNQPFYYYLMLLPIYDFLPVLFGLLGIAYLAIRRSLFGAFLVFWAAAALVVYSYAGEKMPWLVVHLTLPFILIAAKFVGAIIETVDWGAFWRRRGWIAATIAMLGVLLIVGLVADPVSVDGVGMLPGGRAPYVVGLLVCLIVYVFWQGWGPGWRVALSTTGLWIGMILLVHTVFVAWRVTYVNGDTPVEMMVYTQSSPEIPRIAREIADLDQDVGGRKEIRITVDASRDFTWPWAWYLRDYKSVEYLPQTGLTAPPSAQVLLLYSNNETSAVPYLTNYDQTRRYPHRWWFPEDYKGPNLEGLDLSQLWSQVANSENWAPWWAYLTHRQLPSPIGSEDAVFYVQKDFAATQQTVPSTTGAGKMPLEYAAKQITVASKFSFGSKGTEAGQLNEPKGVAVDEPGNIFVADTMNHRVQKFNSSGQFLASIGTLQGNGDGQFNEPWGITVDGKGDVFVADTWNHRIQKFDANLNYLSKWGEFGNPGENSGEMPGKFYGPRGLAVAPDGTILVADTGNKRVQRFDATGHFLSSFGGSGAAEGRFLEPVGIAVDRAGNVYVADTWNHRIQKFDRAYRVLPQIQVLGWEGTGVLNKPFLAVDSKGTILASDPEKSRVLRFAPDGDLLSVVNRLGADVSSFNLPVGLAVDQGDNLYVADALNARIMVFEAMR